ncbi:MAG: DUF6079 family protein [Candidatus Thorarchaeota archaeon]
MKYSEVISFEPIETVLKLVDANNKKRAREHSKTFVMSQGLRDQLRTMVFPQLQFSKPIDNMGIFIVGNYGTGKTHLMSVISSICEHDDILPDVEDDDILLMNMKECQGKFKVIRVEFGYTLDSLRNIVCRELSKNLEKMGVIYSFPDERKITNHIESFHQMMALFEEKYPDKGLLLVIDELLEHLRIKDHQQLIGDLSFLREVGEICKQTRFRIIIGLQESLFDNPAWAHQAEIIKRVRDRYEQVRIMREDVETVVSKRLLQKTPQQKKMIRDHLERFINLYGNLKDRMNDFVDLFPVHPDYLRIFENIHIAERREVLKSISRSMKELIDTDVPDEHPGLITFDVYWEMLKNDASLTTNQDFKEVLDRMKTLEDKIIKSPTKAIDKPTAIKIIHGLGVYRLSTPDILSPLGLSVQEIRDSLFIYIPDMPENDSDFLAITIESIMKEILSIVSGQYISKNADNGQYYIDVKKSVDYDQNIQDHRSMLSPEDRDQAYFDAMRKIVLENPELSPYVYGYRIWEHEILWEKKKVYRPGYIFFGAPNERSTAQPPRDFYIYFLQPFKKPDYRDEKKSDEVFFEISNPSDPKFLEPLEIYASANYLASKQSHAKMVYKDKGDKALKELVKYLFENLPYVCNVTWKGQKRTLKEWKTLPGPKSQVRDIIESVAASCLNNHFEDKYPEYPTFDVIITKDNREDMCRSAIKELVFPGSVSSGRKVLESLELIVNDRLDPRKSKYAKWIMDILNEKKSGTVLNRKDIIITKDGDEVGARFDLEKEFIMVILASLANDGAIVISYSGERIDASNIGSLLKKTMSDMVQFKFIDRPKDMDIAAIKALLRLFSISENLVNDPGLHDEMIKSIQKKRKDILDRTIELTNRIDNDPRLWDVPLFSEELSKTLKEEMNELKSLLESLENYNTPAKLQNFKWQEDELESYQRIIDDMRKIENKIKIHDRLSERVKYIEKARLIMSHNKEWIDKVNEISASMVSQLQALDVKKMDVTEVERKLDSCISEYKSAYTKAHDRTRLDRKQDRRKQEIMNDPRFIKLRQISTIPIINSTQLDMLKDRLNRLVSCFDFDISDLNQNIKCPHCNLDPSRERPMDINETLDSIEEDIDAIEESYVSTLKNNLEDPTVKENMKFIEKEEEKVLSDFEQNESLPDDDLDTFTHAFMEVVSNLEKITITMEEVKNCLISSGGANKPEEILDRFRKLIEEKTKGKSADRVRIIFLDQLE